MTTPPLERREDVQSASSASASPLGTSGELINLSDAESVSKPSPDKVVDREDTPVKMLDIQTPPPAPDFYHRFPAAPASTPMPDEGAENAAEKVIESAAAGEHAEHHIADSTIAPADRVLPRVSSAPSAPVFLEQAAVLEEMDAETRRYIVQHGARSAFNHDHQIAPVARPTAQTAPPALVAVAGAEFDFPGDSDAVSPSAEVPSMPLPSQRLPSVELDPEALARLQRAYIIEQGVRSAHHVGTSVAPIAPVAPAPVAPVAPAAPVALHAPEKAETFGPTDAQKEGEIEKDSAPDACDTPPSGDVVHTHGASVNGQRSPTTSILKPDYSNTTFESARNMDPDVPQPVDAAPHLHFPLTNVEPGPTADTTRRLESVEAKVVEGPKADKGADSTDDAVPHQHFPLTNVEPGPTADTTVRLESVEAKVVEGPKADKGADLTDHAVPHQHFPLTNVEPGPTADTTRRLESVEAKVVGTDSHNPADFAQAIVGEETPKEVMEDVKNPMDNAVRIKETTEKEVTGKNVTGAAVPTKSPSAALTTPRPGNMWWDGNLPRRTAIATLLGAIAYGMYKASLECPQREVLTLACTWFGVAAVNSLQPGKNLVGAKNWIDLTLDTSAKVLAVALLTAVFK